MEIVRVRRTIIRILDSLLSSAQERMSFKMHFWGLTDEEEFQNSNYEAPRALNEGDIPRIVNSISPAVYESLTEAERITVGHAWEFVFGKPAPKEVQKLRENLISRARDGQTLSEQEQRWYVTILLDADMF